MASSGRLGPAALNSSAIPFFAMGRCRWPTTASKQAIIGFWRMSPHLTVVESYSVQIWVASTFLTLAAVIGCMGACGDHIQTSSWWVESATSVTSRPCLCPAGQTKPEALGWKSDKIREE